jgi:hypothetical protein
VRSARHRARYQRTYAAIVASSSTGSGARAGSSAPSMRVRSNCFSVAMYELKNASRSSSCRSSQLKPARAAPNAGAANPSSANIRPMTSPTRGGLGCVT